MRSKPAPETAPAVGWVGLKTYFKSVYRRLILGCLKNFECPKCHFKANACVYQGGAQGADDMPTQLVIPPRSAAVIGQIRVKSTGEIQFLKDGQNVIGRRAKTGTADITISTDMYMSRQHVRIDVVRKGSGYEHRLVEINSKNIVKLNGKPINRGDILILKFGDTMTLGMTDIILESNDEEATLGISFPLVRRLTCRYSRLD